MEEPVVNGSKRMELESRWQLRRQVEEQEALDGPEYTNFSYVMMSGNDGKEFQNEVQEIYFQIYQKLQQNEALTEREEKFLREHDSASYRKVKSIQREIKSYERDLKRCQSREEVERRQESYLEKIRLGEKVTESNTLLPMEKRLEYTLFKDAKVTAIARVTEKFAKSDRYAELPDEGEYSDSQTYENQMQPETGSKERARAKAMYEDFCRSMDQEEENLNREKKPFDAKG